jgi:hypothetical protein
LNEPFTQKNKKKKKKKLKKKYKKIKENISFEFHLTGTFLFADNFHFYANDARRLMNLTYCLGILLTAFFIFLVGGALLREIYVIK